MNCGNCGSPLMNGSNICPSCGALNVLEPVQPQVQVNDDLANDDGFIELDDDIEQITEFMAPPTLNISESESISSGIVDINNAAEVSTYSPEALEQEKEQQIQEENRKKESVDIEIPAVRKPVDNVDMPSDGTAPSVDDSSVTVGEKIDPVPLEEAGSKKKFKLKIKFNKNVPKSLMIMVAIIVLIIGILLGKALFSKNYCVSTVGNNRVNNETKFVADGKNNVTNVGSYTYKIPEDYIFDKSNGGLLIYDKDDTFRIFIRTDKGAYQDLSGAKNSIRETLKENSVAVNGMKEINIADKNYLVFEAATRSVNRMIAFTDASNNYVFYIEIITNDNTYDYDVLDITADILLNATYQEKNTEMEKVDIYDISGVSIKAAEEYKSLMANN